MDEYIRGISLKYARSDAREMIYRADFENMLKSVFGVDGKILQINHDSTNDNGNKPDFVISKNEVPLVYIEAKDIGTNLDKIEKSDQMNRYFGYSNLILTDYIEFRFYRNGSSYGEPISLAKIDKASRSLSALTENYQLLTTTLLDFAASHKEPIKSGKHLAQIMGGKARRIKDNVREMLTSSSDRFAELLKIKDVVKNTLVSRLNDEQFADMYSQTLVYGLFAARYNDNTPEDFSRTEARDLVPASNPFLRSFFDHIAGSTFPDRLRFIVDELCEVFCHTDLEKILKDFYLKEKDNKDPVIHFYEDFLREYDPKKKVEMGVFYTPRPVVQFIVRAIDSILKSEFGLSSGLADYSKIQHEETRIDPKGKKVRIQREYHKVQVLDIATGTGTFLNEVIYLIYESFHTNRGAWEPYVREHLLPRLHGFELMMASYTIAHLKLNLGLSRTGANVGDQRLGVYLTNTLDKPTEQVIQPTLLGFMDSLTEESRLASKVKTDYPIMVIIGNPPYKAESMNPQYTDNDAYKIEPGGVSKLKERNGKWLNDDYVKFLRFAEDMIDKNHEGIVGMITAHGYIDNPTFRGMRWHLRRTFRSIYVLDLHGNSNRKEISPDGTKDENIFDIKTGTAILFGIKKRTEDDQDSLAKVFVHDVFGKRTEKFKFLDSHEYSSISWKELPEHADVWRVAGVGLDTYKEGFSVKDIFPISTTGIVTARDSLVINSRKTDLISRMECFSSSALSDDEVRQKYFGGKKEGKYKLGDSRSWRLEAARKKILSEDQVSMIEQISYRPFDTRYIYYSPTMVDWPRKEVMSNLTAGDNVGLVFARSQKDPEFNAVLASKYIVEAKFGESSTQCMVAPLYIYKNGLRTPNLNAEILAKVEAIVGNVSPEDIFDYVYGSLYKPSYRLQYKEFLKADFPRVPYPKNQDDFSRIAALGKKLRELHTGVIEFSNLTAQYPVPGSNTVDKISHSGNRVYINDDQYFEGVSERIWSMQIGGYAPAQKYLKDRKQSQLNLDEISQYQKIIEILIMTTDFVRDF